MRVSVLQENLVMGLKQVMGAISNKPSMPVLGNVLLRTEDDALHLTGTNLELSIAARIGAKIEEEGAITVPVKTLYDLVSVLPPERIDLELDSRTFSLSVYCGGTKQANVKGIDAAEFPASPEFEVPTWSLPAEKFKEMIGMVKIAAAREDNRPILTGIYLQFSGNKLHMAAADGYRLAALEHTLELEAKELVCIIPAKALTEVAKLIVEDDSTVSIGVDGRIAVFLFGNVTLICQLIEGNFPAYQQIIPKSKTSDAKFFVNELLRACKFAEVFARDAGNAVKLCMAATENTLTPGMLPGRLTVTAVSQERGDNHWSIDSEVQGPGVETSFNVKFLVEGLNVMPSSQVLWETAGTLAAAVFKPLGMPEGDSFLYVVMPMNINR